MNVYESKSDRSQEIRTDRIQMKTDRSPEIETDA